MTLTLLISRDCFFHLAHKNKMRDDVHLNLPKVIRVGPFTETEHWSRNKTVGMEVPVWMPIDIK